MILNILRLILTAFVVVMMINFSKNEEYPKWGPAITAIVVKVGILSLSLLNLITIDF